ncbi:MAG: sulfotransferase domain-containing protein [Proteobacteria bacterium]|nr:sulfotransferase domain-containing protein [Pseudomonadota bacterium]
MGGIIWLASYPKSGNTWLRAFLQNLLKNADLPADINQLDQFAYSDSHVTWYEKANGAPITGLSPQEIAALVPRVQRLMTSSKPESVFVKTHNMMAKNWDTPMISLTETAGVFHVVRNPLDVTLSLADHYGFSAEDAIDFMNNPQAATVQDLVNVPQAYGTWSEHYKSWSNFNPDYYCRLRYEDMLLKPEKTFVQAAKFLQIKPPKNRLHKAIRHSSFKTLQNQEKDKGFKERSNKSEKFFRRGKAGQWKAELSEDQVNKIVDNHFDVMKDLGYLPKHRREG